MRLHFEDLKAKLSLACRTKVSSACREQQSKAVLEPLAEGQLMHTTHEESLSDWCALEQVPGMFMC